MIPRLVLTTGEPAGIGPDLCIQLAQTQLPCSLTVLGDPELLEARARLLGLPLKCQADSLTEAQQHVPGVLNVRPIPCARAAVPGHLDPANVPYTLQCINEAARACLNGQFDAMVTPPVHKAIINQAGFAFTGHTEYIADITGGDPVMMLAVPGLRVALLTTHLPLADVSRAVTRNRVMRTLHILHDDLKYRFGIDSPHIWVAGLNPHAGEGGVLGHEEISIIEPALESLRQTGMRLTGPLPADTLFLPRHLPQADAMLAMYHDQGLPVLKHLGFGRAVNITLGLPIIRTSVDHGTALELAGSGQADAGSLEAAIHAVLDMIQKTGFRPPISLDRSP